eukprot:gnl/MRDRNA2_/MRDRNA2_14745_c0_seq1.p1 gnl/MRDRNA2_/MRDRNA2_14745_c0~~gnl/MRDRNA2_/MRDRNA2_14745_c0_seq1.p1  ORF type:complete len:302 (+),score=45.99 gnl/MRDRNA2_/MRDRNA2_14745_c0_seq1:66-971(+)
MIHIDAKEPLAMSTKAWSLNLTDLDASMLQMKVMGPMKMVRPPGPHPMPMTPWRPPLFQIRLPLRPRASNVPQNDPTPPPYVSPPPPPTPKSSSGVDPLTTANSPDQTSWNPYNFTLTAANAPDQTSSDPYNFTAGQMVEIFGVRNIPENSLGRTLLWDERNKRWIVRLGNGTLVRLRWNIRPMVLFSPTTSWQVVPDGTVLPKGLDIRMDMTTGQTMVRLPKATGAKPSQTPPPYTETYNLDEQFSMPALESHLNPFKYFIACLLGNSGLCLALCVLFRIVPLALMNPKASCSQEGLMHL